MKMNDIALLQVNQINEETSLKSRDKQWSNPKKQVGGSTNYYEDAIAGQSINVGSDSQEQSR